MTPEELKYYEDRFTTTRWPADIGRVWQGWAVKREGNTLAHPGSKFYAGCHGGKLVAVRMTATIFGRWFGWLRAPGPYDTGLPSMVFADAYLLTVCLNEDPVDYAKRRPGERGVRLHLEEIPADGVGDELVEVTKTAAAPHYDAQWRAAPMPPDYTCPCGIHVHPTRVKPGAVHINDCPYKPTEGK